MAAATATRSPPPPPGRERKATQARKSVCVRERATQALAHMRPARPNGRRCRLHTASSAASYARANVRANRPAAAAAAPVPPTPPATACCVCARWASGASSALCLFGQRAHTPGRTERAHVRECLPMTRLACSLAHSLFRAHKCTLVRVCDS